MPTPTKNEPIDEDQSWLYKIVTLPKYLGAAVFDLFGRTETQESSKFIVGYFLLAAVILIALGIISPETVKNLFDYFFK